MTRPNLLNREVNWVPCITHPRNVIHAFPAWNLNAIESHFRSACGNVNLPISFKPVLKWHRAEDCEEGGHTANFTICDDCARVFIMQELAS